MLVRMGWRFATEVDVRLLYRFLRSFCLAGLWRHQAYRRDKAAGRLRPPALFLSVTNRCNLHCRGCWVGGGGEADMPPERFHRIISQARGWGNRFFGILGGEPLLWPDLFDHLAAYPDCYFQLFTNGTVLSEAHARRMRQLGNITPLVSIEGLEEESDARRGGEDVYERSLRALELCKQQRLVFGVATSVCKGNLDMVLGESFARDMAKRGAHYLWTYIYRPVGPDPNPEATLEEDQILRLRRWLVENRAMAPLVLVDSYWDADGRAFCPAAEGLSVHINPAGDIEPCPPLQFAAERVPEDETLGQTIEQSEFLDDFCRLSLSRGGGCILMSDPAGLLEFVQSHDARFTSGRDGQAELAAAMPCPCHDLPGQEIPERNWFFRFAKRNAFFGLGAYG